MSLPAGDIGSRLPPFPRWRQDGGGDGVDQADDQRTVGVRPVGEPVHLLQHAEEVGLRHHQRRIIPFRILRQRIRHDVATGGAIGHFHHLDALMGDDGAHYLAIDGMNGGRYQYPLRFRPAIGTHRHQHRFGQRRRAVIERGVGDLHAGETRHHGLVFVEQLQGTLAGLGLVRGIGGVELAPGGDLPHRSGNVMLIRPCTDEAERLAISRRPLTHQPANLHLVQRLRKHPFHGGCPQLGRNFGKQRLDPLDADDLQHLSDLFLGVWNERHTQDSDSMSLR